MKKIALGISIGANDWTGEERALLVKLFMWPFNHFCKKKSNVPLQFSILDFVMPPLIYR